MAKHSEALAKHWLISDGRSFRIVNPPEPGREYDVRAAAAAALADDDAQGDFTAGGGASSVSNRNRNRNRAQRRNQHSSPKEPGGGGPIFGDILAPWRENRLMHILRPAWEDLPIDLPPSPARLRRDCVTLMDRLVKLEAQPARKEEIVRQASLDIRDYLRPLGVDGLGGFEQTTVLFAMIARLCEEVGLVYKARFDVPRPSVVEPRLRTFLANPPHASYPSNHSFQSFTIAYVFSRVLPEHPGVAALFRVSRRIAENREWAGIHYPSDTAAGRQLARMITPVLEVVLQDQMQRAQAEWI